MASIVNDSGGRKRILFVNERGERKALRVGACSKATAEAVRVRVEALLAAHFNAAPIDRDTARWVAAIPNALHGKLARAGLVEPRENADARLGAMLTAWLEACDVKPSTVLGYKQTEAALLEHFGADKPVSAIGPHDAERWRQAMRDAGLAPATVSKRVVMARAAFKQAVRWGMLDANPFADVRAGSQRNPDRLRFVTLDEARAVLDACPDHEWRLLFALSRFGGLRCPSEHLALRWADVDWERDRLTVRSPKTEAHAGKAERTIPLFPELREHLLLAFDRAEPGAEFVITRYRQRNCNLRTQLERIIKRAGLEPWPRLFHNLRASRQTELAATFPGHVVCSWLGNSERVASEHYLSLLDSDFARAIETPTPTRGAKCGALGAHFAAQRPMSPSGHESPNDAQALERGDVVRVVDAQRDEARDASMAPAGFEPAT